MVDKIGKYQAIRPVQSAASGRDYPSSEKSDADDGEAEKQKHPETREDPSAAFELRGIPAEELSPAVQIAITSLMSEIGELQAEVNWGRGRLRDLENKADKHDYLPILNRVAFLKKVGDALTNRNQMAADMALMLIHVGIGDTVRRGSGFAAHDALLVHIAKVLTDNLHPTDQVAALGGHDFGVLLVLADTDIAEAKRQSVMESLRQQPFLWDGEVHELMPMVGLTALAGLKDAATALEDADRDLMEKSASFESPGS